MGFRFQTLVMLLHSLVPYLTILWGEEAANDAVGYWIGTLQALKARCALRRY
jgi:hypothetical protein